MSLSLPEDIEPWIQNYNQMHSPACYALTLRKPSNPGKAWNEHYDTKPPWYDEFKEAAQCVYVGGTTDLLARLEDHRDGQVRQTTLTRICGIKSLRTVWLVDDEERVWREERKLARAIQAEYPSVFVRQA